MHKFSFIFLFISFFLFSSGKQEEIQLSKEEKEIMQAFLEFDSIDASKTKQALEELKNVGKNWKNKKERQVIDFIYYLEYANYLYYFTFDKNKVKEYLKTASKSIKSMKKQIKQRMYYRYIIARYIGLYYLLCFLSGYKKAAFYGQNFVYYEYLAQKSKLAKLYSILDLSIYNISISGLVGGVSGIGVKNLEFILKSKLKNKQYIILYSYIYLALSYKTLLMPAKSLEMVNRALDMNPNIKFAIDIKEKLLRGDYS